MSAVAVTHPLDVIRLRLSLPRAGYTGTNSQHHKIFHQCYQCVSCCPNPGLQILCILCMHEFHVPLSLMAGMTNALVTIVRTEGGLALYKGFAPALIGTAPFAALNFASYDLLKKNLFDPDVRSGPPSVRIYSCASAHPPCLYCCTTYRAVLCHLPELVAFQ